MQLRKLLLLLGVLSLFMSRPVLALGLGDIELNSSLNQPLDAHISLIDVGDLSSDQIIVNLASQEDFNRVGIERSFFYTQLRFSVVTDGPNGPFIAVTSRDPVREPYLSFVVEVRWTSGRLLREYTVLLDLPTFADDERAQPVEASATPGRSSSQTAKSEPVRSAQEPGAVSATGGSYGPVKANDTLWEIARDVRPGRVSIQQAMLAIQRANPEAFINNNINLLRKGQVLRIPSDSEIRSISTRQAISQVAQQNRDWSGNAMGAQLDASGRRASSTGDSGEVSGRVKLAAPGTTGESGSAQGGGYGSNDAGALSSELAATEEELERSRGENSELRSRVSDLEEQIQTMESLLEAKSEQLRALEVAAASGDEQADAGVDPQAGDTEPSDGAGEPAADGAEEVEAADPQAETAPEQQAEEQPEEPARDVNRVVRSAPEPTLMDKVMDNLLWIGLGVIGLLAAVFFALRKRGGDEPEQEFTAEFDGSVFAEPEADEGEEAQDETFNLDDDSDFDIGEGEPEQAQPTEAETGDVVSEADIYIAYGKYDQAEEMLLKGLEKEPDSLPIKLKLLELYAESDNLSAFDERYGDVLNSGDEHAVRRAQELRSQFANAPEYEGALATAAAVPATAASESLHDEPEPEASDESFDLDLSGDDDELTLDDLDIDGGTGDDTRTESDSDLTLDSLTLSDDDSDSDTTLEDDFEFDLDADLDSDDKAAESATDELELEGASSKYDLSFSGEDDDADDELLDFDLELDDTDEGDKTPEPDDEESFSLDLEDDTSEANEPESELSLDDLDLTLEEPEGEASTDSGDDLELEPQEQTRSPDASESDEQSVPSLSDEAPLLDEDLDATPGESPEPQTDEAPLYDEPEPYAPVGDGGDSEEEVPTLDLADDDADDFDLDQAMGDVDLEALDREMADLDTPEPEPLAKPSPGEPQAGADKKTGASESQAFDVDEDDAFEQALEGADGDSFELDDLPTPETANETDDDEDLDFLADADEAATKLDLARAYIDMGDMDGARDILSEVTEEGNDQQREEAKSLLGKVDS